MDSSRRKGQPSELRRDARAIWPAAGGALLNLVVLVLVLGLRGDRVVSLPAAAILLLGSVVLLWRASHAEDRLTWLQVAAVAGLVVAGLLLGLLYHFDKASGGGWNTELGYPFGWREGWLDLAGTTGPVAALYLRQNAGSILWSMDWPALAVDGLYWLNAAYLVVVLAGRAFGRAR